MEKFKLTLIAIISVGIVGTLAYWSVMSLQSGTEYVDGSKVRQLQKENQDLKKQVNELASALKSLQEKKNAEEAKAQTPPVVVYKYQNLIDELQKLVTDNVVMKKGSSGTRVGTIQKFLNIYNNTNNKIDNDYGPGTITGVTKFQKFVDITADGVASSATFLKMIEWLKTQK